MNEKETKVLIETSMGDITVKLYNDTPKHRDNFIKLAQTGVYDNILFHRIVKDFMVQTGNPGLKPTNTPLSVDTNDFKYTLPAEIVYPRRFHKKGALAAARMADSINPQKESSSTQFYIVTGKVFSPSSLMELRSALYQNKVNALYEDLCSQHMKELYLLRRTGNTPKLQLLKDSLLIEAENHLAKNPPASFTDIQKKVYTTMGGAPHLDNEYTVFGEVIDGIAVAEAIEKIKTNGKEFPVKEIVIKKVTVLE